MTPQKNTIVGVKPDELKAGDIVLRYQMVGPQLLQKPAAKFLILSRSKYESEAASVYFDAYLLWCDENYLGYHNKVGDIWQIPCYAFKNEREYKLEFKCDKSSDVSK